MITHPQILRARNSPGIDMHSKTVGTARGVHTVDRWQSALTLHLIGLTWKLSSPRCKLAPAHLHVHVAEDIVAVSHSMDATMSFE